MAKNILSDTDFTKSWDNRFGITGCIGRVSQVVVNEKGANVRVIMPDRVDHQDNPLITKPVPVLQIASQAKKSFAVPRIDDNVFMIKLPNGTSNYAVLGSFYTSKRPPPVTDPMLDYCIYDDGSTKQFDANNGTETNKLKGEVTKDNQGLALLKFQKSFEVDTQTDQTFKPQGKYTVNAQSDVSIQSGSQITIQAATINLVGHVVVNGNMDENGTHTDSVGKHEPTGSPLVMGLLDRINELERRVRALETAQGVV